MPLHRPKNYFLALAAALTEALVFEHLIKLMWGVLEIEKYSRGVSIGIGLVFTSLFYLGQIAITLGVRLFIPGRKWRVLVPVICMALPLPILFTGSWRIFAYYFTPYLGAVIAGMLLFESLMFYLDRRSKGSRR